MAASHSRAARPTSTVPRSGPCNALRLLVRCLPATPAAVSRWSTLLPTAEPVNEPESNQPWWISTRMTKIRYRKVSVIAAAFFASLFTTLQLHSQDWVRTGTNLGVQKIRLAAADFKPGSNDPQTPTLKSTFDTT